MLAIDFGEHLVIRNALIEKLVRGEINKTEFIIENYKLYEGVLNTDVPTSFNSIEECLYHYQLHNTFAKYFQLQYSELKYKDPFVAVDFRKKSELHYKLKEKVTKRIIYYAKYADIQGVIAYYIKAQSKKLNNKIVEILFEGYEKVVLHTLDSEVISELIRLKFLKMEERISQIDEYINEKYCR